MLFFDLFTSSRLVKWKVFGTKHRKNTADVLWKVPISQDMTCGCNKNTLFLQGKRSRRPCFYFETRSSPWNRACCGSWTDTEGISCQRQIRTCRAAKFGVKKTAVLVSLISWATVLSGWTHPRTHARTRRGYVTLLCASEENRLCSGSQRKRQLS